MSTMTGAELAEYDALLKRYFALQPLAAGMNCFCGSLEELRLIVAELEAQPEREVSA